MEKEKYYVKSLFKKPEFWILLMVGILCVMSLIAVRFFLSGGSQ